MALNIPKTEPKKSEGKGMNLKVETASRSDGKGISFPTISQRSSDGKGMNLRAEDINIPKSISAVSTSALDQSLKVQTTDSQDVDRAGIITDIKWVNDNWPTYNGYYKNHASIKTTINKVGLWSVGRGFIGSEEILDKIRGWGKDTFDSVMNNQVRIRHANGDSYAEIITPVGEELKEDGSNLINLKPLNPKSIGHVINPQGMLEGYKQKLTNGKEKPFRLNQIFHLVLNRTADEIHGTGDIESLMTFLDKIKQLDEDMSVMFHRFVVPLVIWKLNTDNTTKVTAFKTQQKQARNKADDMVVPDIAVDWSLLEAGKTGIDPMVWRNKWVEEVIKGGGVPALIMAIESGTTEASSKMVYLAWQQVIEDEQRNLKVQIKAQLGLDVSFPFPASIEQELKKDESKDGDRTKTTGQEAGKDQK